MSRMPATKRRLSVGVEVSGDSQVAVRVWAPMHATVRLTSDDGLFDLSRSDDGYFERVVPGRPGSRYGFLLGDGPRVYPDPASRFQPDGPDGRSEVIDPSTFAWRDREWRGLIPTGQVLYEMHVGSFTREGTWRAAAAHLSRLRDLGVTAVQMMPIAEFAGAFGWGYDGVLWFAPFHHYGRPDDLRAFVDEAHQLGLGVILDVVYNHLGTAGSSLPSFSRQYISTRYDNEWGAPLNFDGPGSEAVRAFVLDNVEYWITEFHMDGFRLDATQQIFDCSAESIMAAIARRARAAAPHRGVVVTGENEPQDTRLLRPRAAGGCGLDALYDDDFHHAARVALTGVREAYYTDYEGSSRELVAAARWGYLFQGQYYSWQEKTRGTPALDLAPERLVTFLENHDQVANSAAGRRLSEIAHPGDLRALTALLLLMPATPMLFQGQEIGSTIPWVFFADHQGERGDQVRKGRLEFLAQFPRLAEPTTNARIPEATSRATFEACKLTHERDPRAERFWRLHRDLLALRRSDPAFSAQRRPEGVCLGPRALLLRFGDPAALSTRLLLVNLESDMPLAAKSEPLLAPPTTTGWRVLWSSEHPDYGGAGLPPWNEARWTLPAHAAVVLGAEDDGRARG
jgi:maltooligosyltrehalose trehalohydrolase